MSRSLSSVNEAFQSPQATSEIPVFKPRISRKFPRSKSGCLTCRSRRKKCDERVPVCINCERNEIGCSWPLLKTVEGQVPSKRDAEKVRPLLVAFGF